ncbi:Nn.00g024090.m01.CDS01 [Neocucurbitaria sp. VM-36]
MPFWTGNHDTDYKDRLPSPHMHKFHKEIMEIKDRFFEERASTVDSNNVDPEVLAKLDVIEAEGEDLKIKFLTKMIKYCYEHDYPLIPVHVEIQPDLWDAACDLLRDERQAIMMNIDTPHPGLPTTRTELADSLRQRIKPPGPDENDDHAFHSPNYVHRYHTVGVLDKLGDREYVGVDGSRYWVQCGPLRCGVRFEDDKCPHGLCWFMQLPPNWIDGSGWRDGRNIFQMDAEGDWMMPRYQWVGNKRLNRLKPGPTQVVAAEF